MRRREFIALLGGAAMPLVARAGAKVAGSGSWAFGLNIATSIPLRATEVIE